MFLKGTMFFGELEEMYIFGGNCMFWREHCVFGGNVFIWRELYIICGAAYLYLLLSLSF